MLQIELNGCVFRSRALYGLCTIFVLPGSQAPLYARKFVGMTQGESYLT